MKCYNQLILILFFAFFFLIAYLTFFICHNTHVINNNIDKAISEINKSTIVLPCDSLDKFCKQKIKPTLHNDQHTLMISIDTVAIANKQNKILSATNKLNENKVSIIEGNSLTYLLEILSLFLIGLGIFIITIGKDMIDKLKADNENFQGKFQMKNIKLLNELNNECDKSINNYKNEYDESIKNYKNESLEQFNKNNEAIKNLINDNVYSRNIMRSAETINFYSDKLSNLDPTSKDFENKRILACHSISLGLNEINENNQLEKRKIARLSKTYSASLLIEAKRQYEKLGLHLITGYYRDIYNQLCLAIRNIKEMEEFDEN